MTELKILKRNTNDNTEHLRSQGLVPAVLYGSDFESTPVSVDDTEFRKVYRKTGMSHIINTTGDIAGEMCLVQDMQVHVVSGALLHIDFKVVEKGQKTEVSVPVVLVGESLAVGKKLGVVNFLNEEILVECIPSIIPESIQVDISTLIKVGDSIKLKDLKTPKGVSFLDDMEMTIATIVIPKENIEESSSDEVTEPELVDQKGGEKELSENE